jgi:hypothetical protein
LISSSHVLQAFRADLLPSTHSNLWFLQLSQQMWSNFEGKVLNIFSTMIWYGSVSPQFFFWLVNVINLEK